MSDAAWQRVIGVIERNDQFTRGIVILGLGESELKLAESFAVAARYPLVKGFAVKGEPFLPKARPLEMAGELTDEQAIADMAENYQRLCNLWDDARAAQLV